MVVLKRALADTSVFIGLEATRFDPSRFDGFEWGVSAVTLGELRLGVLQAQNPEAASRRLSTYQRRGEMHVVWLITRGRGFKSLPRYQGQRPFLEQRKGLCMWFVN